MKHESSQYYDPYTVKMMQTVLDEAWTALHPEQRARSSKALLATLILDTVAAGERDPALVRATAVTRLVAGTL
jgi:hypothetical protein